MASPKVSVILALVDQLTAPIESARKGVAGFGGKLKDLGREAKSLLENRLIQGIGLGGMIAGIKAAFDAADRLEASTRKLAGTAKVTGVPLEVLSGIADRAKTQFQLSSVQANDFAVEMAKLATKAGDVGQAGPLLESFLNIGAAKGLTAGETLKAVQQAILGIDEGTDKLFNANPSVLYQQFADAIGVSAGKLTDQQKAQALATAALQDGAKVTGSYADFLSSAAGQQELLRIKTEEAAATLGQSLGSVRTMALPILAGLTEGFVAFIGGIQLWAVDIALFYQSIPVKLREAGGNILLAIGEILAKAEPFFSVFGEGFGNLVTTVKESGQAMIDAAKREAAVIEQVRDEEYKAILGITTSGENRRLEITTDGADQRTEIDKEEAKRRKKIVEDVQDEIALKTLMFEKGLTEKEAKEQLARARNLGTHTQQQVRTIEEGYAKIDQLNLLLAAGFDQTLRPSLKRTEQDLTNLKPPINQAEDAVDTFSRRMGISREKVEAWLKSLEGGQNTLKETKVGLDDAARAGIGMAQALGMIKDGIAAALQNAVSLGKGIADLVGGGLSTGQIIGAVTGVVGAIGGLAKSIFGAESAADRTRRLNTTAIEKLTNTVGEFNLNVSGNTITKVEQAVKEALAAKARTGSSATAQTVFDAALRSRGLTPEDAAELMRSLGLQTPRANKDAFVQSLRDLQTALGVVELTTFGKDLAGQRQKLDTELAFLGDAATPFLEFQKKAALFGGEFGSSAIANALAGAFGPDGSINVGKGRAGLAGLLAGLEGLSRDQLGGFTPREFTAAIIELKNLLDEIAASAEEGAAEVPAVPPPPVIDTGDFVPQPPAIGALIPADVAELKVANEHLVEIRDLLEARLFDPTAPTAAGPATALGAPQISVTIEHLSFGVPLAGGTPSADGFARLISERLYDEILQRERVLGLATRAT